jgi:hypothetical protein
MSITEGTTVVNSIDSQSQRDLGYLLLRNNYAVSFLSTFMITNTKKMILKVYFIQRIKPYSKYTSEGARPQSPNRPYSLLSDELVKKNPQVT